MGEKTIRETILEGKNNGKVILIGADGREDVSLWKVLVDKGFSLVNTGIDLLKFDLVDEIKPDLIVLSSPESRESRAKVLNFCFKLKKSRTSKHIPILIIFDRQSKSGVIDYYASKVDLCLISPVSEKELLKYVDILLNDDKGGNKI
jgi:DNA-binding response OmpR family regulator